MLRLIWKYKFHYVLVFPILLLLILLKVVPFLTAMSLPFIDYSPFRGMTGSPWVGWDNFKELFETPHFPIILSNTLTMKLLTIGFSAIVAFVLALALHGIRSSWLRSTVSMLILLPYFLPTVVLGYIAILLASEHSPLFGGTETLVLARTEWWPLIMLLVYVVKYIGIPTLIALAAIQSKQMDSTSYSSFSSTQVVPALQAVVAFSLVQLSAILSTDFELVNMLYNPLVYEVADTLDTYAYRTGYLTAQYSLAGVIWWIQFLVQFVLTILIYFLVRGWLGSVLFSRYDRKQVRQTLQAKRKGGPMWIALLPYVIVLMVLFYFLLLHPFLTPSLSDAGVGAVLPTSTYLIHLFLTGGAVLVYTLMTLCLAYPLTVRNLPGRTFYKLFLLLILAMGSGGIHEFLFYKDASMINTFYPPLLTGMVSVLGVFVLKEIFNSKHAELKQQAIEEGRGELHSFFTLYIPKIWKPLLALAAIQITTVWNAYTPSMIYTADATKLSPAATFHLYAIGGGTEIAYHDPLMLQAGLVVSLPSLIVFFLFSRWITSEVLVSQARKG